MNIRKLFALINTQRLIQVHRERNGGTPSIDVLAWVRILRGTKPTSATDYALLGVTCGDGICRAMVVDMLYISALVHKQSADLYPRIVDLGRIPWADVMAMEVCQENVDDVGCEELVDEIIRWIANENMMPLQGDELSNVELEEILAKLRSNMEKAIMQHISEHGYTE